MARLAAVIVGALLALPSLALAAPRYASPTGSGTACSADTPCDLPTAVSMAATGDNVIVAAGTYNLTAQLAPTVELTIQGAPGARPLIVGASGTTPLRALNTGVALQDLTIEGTNSDGVWLVGTGSTADRVEVTATGGNIAIRTGPDTVVRDSLAVSSGPNAGAIFLQGAATTNDVILRNVTAIASGTSSFAVGVFGTMAAMSAKIEATNVIADGETDLSATGQNASVQVDHSNFDTSTGTLTQSNNQNTLPQFANAASGDYHQAAGSPTIGAGVTDPLNGSLDLDGLPRTTASATDIGAYQSQPATQPTPITISPAPPGGDKTPPKTRIRGLTFAHGVVSATLSCPAGETRCNWRYTLRTSSRVRIAAKPKRRFVTLGSGKASAAGGQSKAIDIKLSKRNRRLLRRLHRLAVTLRVVGTDSAGNKSTTRFGGKLRLRRGASH